MFIFVIYTLLLGSGMNVGQCLCVNRGGYKRLSSVLSLVAHDKIFFHATFFVHVSPPVQNMFSHTFSSVESLIIHSI